MSPENEWPFDIPKHWAWSSLGAIAEIKGGITKDQKRKVEGGRLVPYLRVANVQRGYLDLSEVKEIEATEEIIRELKLEDGDVLFTEGGDRDKLGRGWVWREEIHECIHQNHIFRARVLDPGISPKLVSWYSNAFGQPYFMKEGKQTTNLASVNLTKLKVFPVPIPPTEEQGRLIAKIEELSTKLDAGVEALKKAQALLKRYRASVLKAACEGRLVPTEAELARREGRDYEPADKLLARILKERREAWEAAELVKLARKGTKVKGDAWKKKYQEPAAPNTDELPELPEGWAWASFEQLVSGSMNGLSKRSGTEGKPVNVLRLADIKEGSISDLSPRAIVLSDDELVKYQLVADDLVCIRVNGSRNLTGRLIRFNSDSIWTFCDHFIRFRIVISCPLPTYIRYFFDTKLARKIIEDGMVTTAGQNTVSQPTVLNVPIPIPPLAEQSRIVDEIERQLSIAEQLETVFFHTDTKSTSLRQAILKYAFQGKLVPQDPNDEPASVLLERIKAARTQATPTRKTTRARRATRRS